jgi:HD superfamily phosphodiesterase
MKLDDYLFQFEDLKLLYNKVAEEFSSKGLVHHNWNHVLRDLARGIIIGDAEETNMKIVLASILLHDIGRLYPEKGEDHHAFGANMAPKYLMDAGFTDKEIEEIKHCIRAHGPRGVEEPQSLEAMVCYDVDVLSCSVGYIGVARVFSYFMREEKLNVRKMVELPSGRKGPRKDFYTESGRKIGEEGLARARNFWGVLEREFQEEKRIVKEIIPSYNGD